MLSGLQSPTAGVRQTACRQCHRRGDECNLEWYSWSAESVSTQTNARRGVDVGDRHSGSRPRKASAASAPVDFQFGQQWNIATPFVFRYEDTKWIDAFFETGALRLSTFAKFATYQDEVRGDATEGRGFCYGETAENKSVFVAQAQGINAVVLCCSHKLDHKLREGFSRNSAFEITNTMAFALEVSRQLRGFRGGLEGSCLYRADASIKRAVDFDFEKYKRPDGNMDMQMIFDAGNALGGPELLLLKRKQYAAQQEYRLLWELDILAGDYVDVVTPNARQYCRRVEPEEWG